MVDKVSELKIEHVLLFVIVAFLLYRHMGKCGMRSRDGFSVGGQVKCDEEYIDNSLKTLEQLCCTDKDNCLGDYPINCYDNKSCRNHISQIFENCNNSPAFKSTKLQQDLLKSCPPPPPACPDWGKTKSKYGTVELNEDYWTDWCGVKGVWDCGINKMQPSSAYTPTNGPRFTSCNCSGAPNCK